MAEIVDRPDEIIKNADDASKVVLENYWRSRDNIIIPFKDKWMEWYKAYRSYVEIDDDDIRSNFFIPMIFAAVEAYLPRLVANRPRIEVWGRGPEDQPRADLHRALIFYDWAKLQMALTLVNWAKSALVYGTGLVKVVHKREFRKQKIRSRVETPLQIPFSQVMRLISQRVTQIETRAVYDDPYAELLDLDAVFPDPDGYSEDTCAWMIHRVPMRLDEIEAMDIFDESAVKELKDLIGTANPMVTYDREPMRNERRMTFGPETKAPSDPYKRQVHLLEQWTDSKVTVVVEEFPQIKPLRNEHHELGMKPFIRFTPVPMPLEFYGVGMPEILFSINLETNTLHNARMDQLLMSAYPMMSLLRGSNINPKKIRFRPGGHFWVDDHNDYDFVQIPPLQAGHYRESDHLRMWGQLASGSTDPFAGLQSNLTGGTATEASLLSQAANSRAGLMFQILTEQSLKRMGRLLIRINEAHIDEQRQIRIAGDDFSLGQPIMVDPDVLTATNTDLDVVIDVAATEPETLQFRRREAMLAIQTFIPIFGDPNHPYVQRFLAELARTFKIDNPEALLQQPIVPPQAQGSPQGIEGDGSEGQAIAAALGAEMGGL